MPDRMQQILRYEIGPAGDRPYAIEERFFELSIEELQSRPFFEFVHPDDRERTLNQNRDVRGGGHALSFENRYLCKDGSFRWLRWNARRDSAQQLIYAVARDITDEREAEGERERLVAQLQSALAEISVLHESEGMRLEGTP